MVSIIIDIRITQYNNLIMITGSDIVSDDIQPTSGSVRFSTGSDERMIQLEIQSDSIPEDDEVTTVIIAGLYDMLIMVVRYSLFS